MILSATAGLLINNIGFKKMSIEIVSKGETIALEMKLPTLNNLIFAGGWSPANTGGKSADVDLVALVLNEQGKLLSGNAGLIYYGNKKHSSGAIVHGGDNLTGEGDGDDETINVDLTKLPAEAKTVRFIATIYDARNKKQDFTQIKDEYVRLYDVASNEGVKFESDFGAEETFVAADVVRTESGWSFTAIGLAVDGVLSEYVNSL